ncbi:MAG: hypothetical protein U5R31_06220 [Acidimicrobiia bacterium]|nr:hypothetical protein [Acidimicrobiia bacterium]
MDGEPTGRGGTAGAYPVNAGLAATGSAAGRSAGSAAGVDGSALPPTSVVSVGADVPDVLVLVLVLEGEGGAPVHESRASFSTSHGAAFPRILLEVGEHPDVGRALVGVEDALDPDLVRRRTLVPGDLERHGLVGGAVGPEARWFAGFDGAEGDPHEGEDSVHVAGVGAGSLAARAVGDVGRVQHGHPPPPTCPR